METVHFLPQRTESPLLLTSATSCTIVLLRQFLFQAAFQEQDFG